MIVYKYNLAQKNSDVKLKESIFIGSEIRKLMSDCKLRSNQNTLELIVWDSYVSIVFS